MTVYWVERAGGIINKEEEELKEEWEKLQGEIRRIEGSSDSEQLVIEWETKEGLKFVFYPVKVGEEEEEEEERILRTWGVLKFPPDKSGKPGKCMIAFLDQGWGVQFMVNLDGHLDEIIEWLLLVKRTIIAFFAF